jgi:hypothetical protein
VAKQSSSRTRKGKDDLNGQNRAREGFEPWCLQHQSWVNSDPSHPKHGSFERVVVLPALAIRWIGATKGGFDEQMTSFVNGNNMQYTLLPLILTG